MPLKYVIAQLANRCGWEICLGQEREWDGPRIHEHRTTVVLLGGADKIEDDGSRDFGARARREQAAPALFEDHDAALVSEG